MTIGRALLVLAAATFALSCNPKENGERGGEPERLLALATVAGEEAKVKELLAAGANPNKMARFEEHYQSPWKLALHQVRPGRQNLINIVQAMLNAHADPEVAWGEAPSRRGGYSSQPVRPISEAVSNSVPGVARAIMKAGLNPHLAEVQLELAVENRQTEIVHILVGAGVDVNTTASAITPLVAAVEARDIATMTYLEDHGAREKP